MEGIDVSHFQGDIDWVQVKNSGIDFAFIKATDGITEFDPKFSENWQAAQQAGIRTGAYHFYRPRDDAQQQAQHFIKILTDAGIGNNNLPMALDVEIADGVSATVLQQSLNDLLATILQATQITPLIYTDPSFWNTSVGVALYEYPLWIANWISGSSPTLPHGWSDWQYWQYSSNGRVPGIAGPVDLNRSR